MDDKSFSTPSPRAADSLRIGGSHWESAKLPGRTAARLWLRAGVCVNPLTARRTSSIARSSRTTRSAPSRSALLTAKMSATSRMPALIAWTSSPIPGTRTTTVVCAIWATSISSWPTPTVSTMMTSCPIASITRMQSPVERDRPPRLPRVARERMKTLESVACACIRIRSPRIAPPVNALVGSTAITLTDLSCLRKEAISPSTIVDLPEPGGPVIPITYARPVRGNSTWSSSIAPGSASSIRRISLEAARTSPRRIRSERRPAPKLTLLDDSAADDGALNLAGALADFAELGIAQIALHRKLARVPVATMDLDRLVAGAHRSFRGKQLGHRRLLGEGTPRVRGPGRALHQKSRGIDFHLHVCQHPLNRLKIGDRPAERHSLPCIGDRFFQRAASEPDGERADGDPPPVEDVQRVEKAAVYLPQALRVRYLDAVEEQLRRVGGPHPQLAVHRTL